MSKRIFLAAYKLTAKNGNGQLLPLSANQLRDGIERRLGEVSATNGYKDDVQQRSAKMGPFQREHENIYGHVFGGTWGESGYGENVLSGQRSFDISEHDSLNYPYFFHFSLPEFGSTGWFIASKYGAQGIKEPFFDWLNEAPIFGNNSRLHANPIAPERLLQPFLINNACTSVEFIKYAMSFGENPAHIEVQRQTREGQRPVFSEDAGKIVVKVDPRRNVSLRGIADFFLHRDIRELFAPRSLGLVGFDEFIPDEVAADFEYNGQTKKFYFNNIRNLCATLDVTEEVQYVGGNPTTESMLAKSKEFAQLLLEEARENESPR